MTPTDILARLEEAGRTLMMLPGGARQARMNAQTFDLAPDPPMPAGKLRLTAEPAAIDRMDEALGWLSRIPPDRFVLRRIVGARAMMDPLTGRHLFPWRRLAAVLGADHKAVQRWHAQGIAIIAASLQSARKAA